MGLCSLSAYSQTIDGFTVYKKFPKHNASKKPFVHQLENLIYFPNIKSDEFRILDFHGSERVWTPFNLNLSSSDGVLANLEKYIYAIATIPFAPAILYYPYISGVGGGFFKLTDFTVNNPQMKFISFEDFFGIPEPTTPEYSAATVAAVQYLPVSGKGYVWCYIDSRGTGSLKFSHRDKPDSVIATYEFPEYKANNDGGYDGFQVISNGAQTDIMYNQTIGVKNDLFFKATHPLDAIVKFDTKTEEFTRYLPTELPLVYDTLEGVTSTSRDIRGNEMLLNASHNCWLIRQQQIKEIDGTNNIIVNNNVLLTYNPDSGFKSINLNPKDKAKYYTQGKCMANYFGIIDGSVIWFTYTNYDTTLGANLYKTEIITYDVSSGEYGSMCIPIELIGGSDFDVTTTITSVKRLKHPDGYDVIGILLSSGYFLFYNPTNGIAELDNSNFQHIGIRNITPNPATSSVNVNIMYYPSGIYSNDLEVGLYNYMGEKVINLTPLGTYTEHNHTWEATFDIPKRLASGMYFLNVRSGDESRTKGIAIY